MNKVINNGFYGGCLCGAVRFKAEASPIKTVHCHCGMCRKNTGALFGTFTGFPAEAVTITASMETNTYQSSAHVRRRFCGNCGSLISVVDERDPETLWLTTGCLDEPEETEPSEHWFDASRVEWLNLADQLPRYADFPPGR